MSSCVEGLPCGPELLKRGSEDDERWCCFWCGMPLPLDELPERLGGNLVVVEA